MHSALSLVALAAAVSAVPFNKRAVVVDTATDVVYKTVVATVTATETAGSAPTQAVEHHQHDWTTWSNTWSTTWGGWNHPTQGPQPTVVTVTKSEGWTTKAPAPYTTEQPAPEPTTVEQPSPPAPWATTHMVDPTTPKPHKTKQPQPPSGAKPTSYAQRAVVAHNLHRANHSAPMIQWSTDLESSAQTIAESCVYAHNTAVDGGGYGQNIAAGVKGNNITAVITNLFYNGEVGWYNGLYGQAQPSMANFEHWGHFSQVVWKHSTHVGCYTADCSSQGLKNTGGGVLPFFTVCNYKGAGNYANEYGDNIGSPLGHPTAQWNTGL